jgi:hypothetical protein
MWLCIMFVPLLFSERGVIGLAKSVLTSIAACTHMNFAHAEYWDIEEK